MIKNKNFSIKMYATTFWGMAGRGGREEKDEIILVWLDYFSYINTDKELMLFIKACQAILDEERLINIPMPGYIKKRMRDIKEPDKEPLKKKPIIKPEFKKLMEEKSIIFDRINSCRDYETRKKLKLQYKDIVLKMCEMSGEKRGVPEFIKAMTENSYVDLRLKEGKLIDKNHISNSL